jgi:L-fucose mutarotase
MLKGIDHRLNAELLYVLRAMGHGDMLVLADCNFPSHSVAKSTTHGGPLSMENLSSAAAAAAILSVMPLDTFVADFAMRMEVVGNAGDIPAVQSEVRDAIDHAEGRHRPMTGIDRYAFYDLAKQSFAVLRTGEQRFYGCFILRKGVIPPGG